MSDQTPLQPPPPLPSPTSTEQNPDPPKQKSPAITTTTVAEETQLTEGIRVTALRNIFTAALERSIKTCSYENFAACFPTPARRAPEVLRSAWEQMCGFWENSAKLTPLLLAAQREVVGKIEVVQGSNTELMGKIEAQRREIEELVRLLEGRLGMLDGAVEVVVAGRKEVVGEEAHDKHACDTPSIAKPPLHASSSLPPVTLRYPKVNRSFHHSYFQMPKRKFPPIRSNKRKKKLPETSEEFLDVGIELEESGDRWRAGDKIKAGRFYYKAIESYEAALQRNPKSFDAAYNRARLFYQLAQNSNFLPTPSDVTSKALLEKAVQSHRECLVLSPENQDTLFNAGQALCSLAEVLVEYKNAPVEARSEALNFLCEAVEIYQKCLQVQESQYASFGQGSGNGVKNDEGDTDMDADEPEDPAPSGEGDQEDEQMSEGSGSDNAQWVMVQPPVTLTQILDTALAQLEACASLLPLCALQESLGGEERCLSWAQSMGETLLSAKIIPLSQETGREEEVALAKANFGVSLGEANFRGGLTDLAGWEAAIHLAFPKPEESAWDFQELCDRADAHIQLASTAAEKTEEGGEAAAANLAWKHYALAAKSLSEAARLEPLKSEIHIARGDVEILRAKLGIPAAVKSRDVLVKNAGVYYRGAKRLECDLRIRIEAAVKEAMVAFEGGDGGALLRGIEMGPVVKEVVMEAVDEGLFGVEWLVRVGL
ncbi:hypothetical protein L873DRAFT_1840353 [Choiromyces venosus 120613-1]|uniref:TPR-like protein n=1 Tax=Choiromyces venosus 120613-1 TaxID=1336337 RepID=A0A3N4K5X2_9PEZI|nr:hypothetical protein L873DRAFT_1840353 [Choiromyces venosus 120613-1]